MLQHLLVVWVVSALLLQPLADGRAKSPKQKARSRPPGAERATTHPGDARLATEPLGETLREYQIRLNAHRRELLAREQELQRAEDRIVELNHRLERRAPASGAARPPKGLERVSREPDEAQAAVPERRDDPALAADAPPADEALIASLRQDLDVERESRKTLEEELQRVLSQRRSEEQDQQTLRSLESAKAEILLLHHRLEDEERAREALEVLLARARSAAAVGSGTDWIDRFEATMQERRQQADRLRGELHIANETIVSLKARIEADPQGALAAPALDALKADNDTLRGSLHAAEQANSDLRAQAELAARLADMLYGQGSK